MKNNLFVKASRAYFGFFAGEQPTTGAGWVWRGFKLYFGACILVGVAASPYTMYRDAQLAQQAAAVTEAPAPVKAPAPVVDTTCEDTEHRFMAIERRGQEELENFSLDQNFKAKAREWKANARVQEAALQEGLQSQCDWVIKRMAS